MALRTKYNPANFKNLTEQQKKQQIQDEQAEIKVWASTNNIDPKYVGIGSRGFGRMGMDEKFGKWYKPTPTPTP